jgi:hypothetical protein
MITYLYIHIQLLGSCNYLTSWVGRFNRHFDRLVLPTLTVDRLILSRLSGLVDKVEYPLTTSSPTSIPFSS